MRIGATETSLPFEENAEDYERLVQEVIFSGGFTGGHSADCDWKKHRARAL
jgi:hypothetical protein